MQNKRTRLSRFRLADRYFPLEKGLGELLNPIFHTIPGNRLKEVSFLLNDALMKTVLKASPISNNHSKWWEKIKFAPDQLFDGPEPADR